MLLDTGPKIVAFVGETILLPCITTINSEVPTVEWTKEGLFPNTAFLYRDGFETFEMKNPVFQYRTNLIMHKLHDGNLSMVISNVQLNDSGNYQCAIRRNRKKKVITRLELFVCTLTQSAVLYLSFPPLWRSAQASHFGLGFPKDSEEREECTDFTVNVRLNDLLFNEIV